jgi:hypothetical protein
MNLKQSIRRILKEEGFGITPIRRRISPNDMEEAFDYSLETNTKSMDNPNSVIYKGKNTTLWVFAKFVIDDMITLIEQEYFNDDNRIYFSDNEEDYESYHEKIRQPLLRHYGKRIKEKYKEVMSSNDGEMIQETIRRILREETTYVKDVRVNISDILPINRDGQSIKDAILNVKDGLISQSQEPPLLLKKGNKYEILDGFHRIAQKILDGKKYITSDIMIKY